MSFEGRSGLDLLGLAGNCGGKGNGACGGCLRVREVEWEARGGEDEKRSGVGRTGKRESIWRVKKR